MILISSKQGSEWHLIEEYYQSEEQHFIPGLHL